MNTLPRFRGLNLIPFAGSVIKNNQLDYNEIILNMMVFIPFGLYLSMIKLNWSFWKKIISIAGVSLLFELLQFLFEIGGTDITDFISNTLGGVVGIGFYIVFSKILKEKTNKILNILALIGNNMHCIIRTTNYRELSLINFKYVIWQVGQWTSGHPGQDYVHGLALMLSSFAGGKRMTIFEEYLSRIDNPPHRARTEEVLGWVTEKFPN